MSREPRTERVPVAMAEPSRGAAWLRSFRLSGFALTVLLLVVAALVVLAPRLKTLVEQRQQIAQLEESVASAHEQVDALKGEVARWEDPAYVESQARDRLYYVFPGDDSYLVIDSAQGPTAPQSTQPISDTIQSTRVDWLTSFLTSVYTAGLTEAPPPDDALIQSPSEGDAG